MRRAMEVVKQHALTAGKRKDLDALVVWKQHLTRLAEESRGIAASLNEAYRPPP